MSGSADIGDLPVVGPITLRDEVHSGVELFHMVDRFFGGGLTAGQLHAELQPVCDGPGKGRLEHIRHVLNATSSYTANHITTELQAIEKDLLAAYQGAATGTMQTKFEKAATMLAAMSPKFSSLASGINSTQDTLDTAWKSVKDYSRFGSDMSNVESLNPFGGGESDDDKANDAWNAAKLSLAGIGSTMAATNQNPYTDMNSSPYTPPNDTNPTANIPDPGSSGPGPGSFAPGPGPGHFTPGGPGHFHPGGPGPGSPGYPGPGNGGPGYGGPGGGPGFGGPGTGPGYGPGGFGPGGPGPGLNTGSDLAGAGPGPGPGPGFGGPGTALGGGTGDASGLAGAGGPGAGAAAGAGGPGALGAVPLGARGGAGGGGDSDRERSTWLTEDDDVWGDSDAPDGVIS